MLQLRFLQEKISSFLSWFWNVTRLAKVSADPSARDALFVFVLTRSLIFVIFIFVGHLTIVTLPDSPTNIREPFIRLEGAPIAKRLRETMWRADVAHYMVISRAGYQDNPSEPASDRGGAFAFFPLFPLMLWLLSKITSDVMLVSAALSNLFFLIALFLLHKLTLASGYEREVARRAVFYMGCFPVSYFFSVPLTESLFVLLAVGSFYAAKKDHWWTAGAIGALASATRVVGVLLLPALLVLSWQQYRMAALKKAVGLALVPFGLFAFMFYSWWRVGNAWAFRDSVAVWGRKPTFFLKPLLKYIIHPQTVAEPWNFNLLNAVAVLLVFFGVYVLIKRREWALAAFALISVLLALSSGMLQSQDRYALANFPIFIALALTAGSYTLDQTIRFIFIACLGIMTALYAANYTIAVS